MKVELIHVGYMSENCYVLIDDVTKNCIIVDPGDWAENIISKILEFEATPKAILLTHGHYDHTGAVDELREHYGIKVYANKEEEQVLSNRRLHLGTKTVCPDEFFTDEQILEWEGFSIKVLHTPGHTPGGSCFYLEKEKVLFSGDTLFHESVGRTDFQGGSMAALIQGIKEKLFVLPEDVLVYPGHMEATTIGHEKQYNPFI